MSAEGPYRDSGGFAEKKELLILAENVSGLRSTWRKEVSRLNFIWTIMALVSLLMWAVYYANIDRRLNRHEGFIERISMRQSSCQVERVECNHRQQYMLGKQEASQTCAEQCLQYLNTAFQTTSEFAERGYARCRHCLMSVRTPMPFEIAHPEYSRIRKK